MWTLHLTSYNIQHGEGLDKKIDHARQAKILRKAHADVAAIQEVDSMTKRNGGLYSLEEIGRKAKMHATFAPAINFQGGKYGIGLLSKKRPMSVRRIPLPGREESRMLLVAEFKHYVVACTHLSLTDDDRMASVPLIVEEASKWQKPFIIMGDLNDEPGMPFYKEMQKHFLFLNPAYDKTFPAEARTRYRALYVPKLRKPMPDETFKKIAAVVEKFGMVALFEDALPPAAKEMDFVKKGGKGESFKHGGGKIMVGPAAYLMGDEGLAKAARREPFASLGPLRFARFGGNWQDGWYFIYNPTKRAISGDWRFAFRGNQRMAAAMEVDTGRIEMLPKKDGAFQYSLKGGASTWICVTSRDLTAPKRNEGGRPGHGGGRACNSCHDAPVKR